MEKFIEELNSGDFFELEDKRFIITSDFKKNGDRLCIEINNGNARWLKSSCHVDHIFLYAMDSNNNFTPIKEIKSDATPQTPGLF
jgi:hypothetical protein